MTETTTFCYKITPVAFYLVVIMTSFGSRMLASNRAKLQCYHADGDNSAFAKIFKQSNSSIVKYYYIKINTILLNIECPNAPDCLLRLRCFVSSYIL